MIPYRYSGVGTLLCLASDYIYNNRKEIAIVDDSLIKQLFSCFGITDSMLSIKHMKSKLGETPDDYCKFFSPYYKPNFIRYKGRNLEINNSTLKPCVGVAMYYNTRRPIGELEDQYPDYKFQPISKNLLLVEALIDAGYDVLVLDNSAITLEDKIYLMNEYCDMIVGYEGGLQHLAHSLDIPSIILPYSFPRSEYYSQIIHLDQKTYFMTQSELDKISSRKILSIREKLLNNQGNNIFLKGKVSLRNDLKEITVGNIRHTWTFNKLKYVPSPIKKAKIGGIKKFQIYK